MINKATCRTEDQVRDIQLTSSPSAVLLVEKGEDHVYAITFGHLFFLVDKFAEFSS